MGGLQGPAPCVRLGRNRAEELEFRLKDGGTRAGKNQALLTYFFLVTAQLSLGSPCGRC